MEITFKGKDHKFAIPNDVITGIYSSENIFDYKGTLIVDKEKVTNKNKEEILKGIIVVENKILDTSFTTLEEYMNYYIEVNNLNIKDPDKKIMGSLKIVGLKEKVLKKSISALSSTEKSLASLATALLTNPKEIILKDFFIYFDIKLEKKIYRLLMELNDKYKIGIILYDNDIEKLYKYASYIIIIKKDFLIEGATKEVFNDANLLLEHGVDLPDIVEFTYKARKIGAKIDYHRDIRDIIKDIYKHI